MDGGEAKSDPVLCITGRVDAVLGGLVCTETHITHTNTTHKQLVTRFSMAWTTSPLVLLITLLGPNTMAATLGIPVMTIAVKRFTTIENRGFAFSLFYSLMNCGALLQAFLLDIFRGKWKDGFAIDGVGGDALVNNGTRLFVCSGCIASAVGLGLSFLLTNKTKPREGDGDVDGGVHKGDGRFFSLRAVKEMVGSNSFIKFLVMCVLTVNLKSLFRHLDASLPKYQLRAFGDDVPIGSIYAINPAMIVLLVPVVGAVTTRIAHFDMIHYGSWVSSFSPLWIVIWPRLWATAAFVAMLSLGEALWSPRWYDYSMSVAPEGREGLFTAMVSAPLFLATMPTGVLSGYLLERYCPMDGGAAVCDGRRLWGVVFGMAVLTPVAILVFQWWLRPRGDDMDVVVVGGSVVSEGGDEEDEGLLRVADERS